MVLCIRTFGVNNQSGSANADESGEGSPPKLCLDLSNKAFRSDLKPVNGDTSDISTNLSFGRKRLFGS